MSTQHDPSPKASSLAALFLQRPSDDGSVARSIAWQMDHRLGLAAFWAVAPGARVLEIGCGQGDCTLVLADAVGEAGHVDALDPGAPDYGAPYTLSQSQSHITSGPLGRRITFHNAHPVAYLSSLPPSTPAYDFVVLSHCIWYFSSPAQLSALVAALRPHTKTLCLAEWSLRAATPATLPHVLTALLLASLEAKRAEEGRGNIRTVLSPAQIRAAVEGKGGEEGSAAASSSSFALAAQDTRPANEGLKDAFWEVTHTLRKRGEVLGALARQGVDERELAAMEAMYDAIQAGVDVLEAGESGVRSMDVWVARFDCRRLEG